MDLSNQQGNWSNMQFLTHISFLQENKFYIKEFPVKCVRGKYDIHANVQFTCVQLCWSPLKIRKAWIPPVFFKKQTCYLREAILGECSGIPIIWLHWFLLLSLSLVSFKLIVESLEKCLPRKQTKENLFSPKSIKSINQVNQTSHVTLKTF